jgi:hypothetical protein
MEVIDSLTQIFQILIQIDKISKLKLLIQITHLITNLILANP